MIAILLALVGRAAEVVPTAPLAPGVPGIVEVGGGDPARVLLTAGAAVVTPLPPRGAVARFTVHPPLGADSVELVAEVGGATVRSLAPLALPGPAALALPARVDGTASAEPIRIPVAGEARNLAVASSEGTVRLIDGPGGLAIELVPADGGGAREILVSARDTGSTTRPAFSVVHLRVRRSLAFTTEPGTSVEVLVNERRYGPEVAGASGKVSVTVDQFPGESRASAILSDDLGNATRSDVALGTTGGVVGLVVPLGAVVPGREAPPLWLRVVREDGSPWSGRAPACRVPGAEIAVREVEPGSWLGVLPPRRPVLDELRVSCEVGAVALVSILRASAQVPDRLALQVFPTELGAEDPTAEVRAVLQDAAGNRLPATGVSLSAERGTVRAALGETGVMAGTYDGAAAGGGDTVTARWTPAPVTGPAAQIALAWPPMIAAGRVPVWARVLDPEGRPVAGAPVSIEVGEVRAEGQTGGDGWFSALFPLGGSEIVRARTADRRCAGILAPGDPGLGEPGGPLLQASEDVRIRVGTVTGIRLTVDPPVLRAGPGSFAIVSVHLSDRSGRPVSDAEPVLEASAGRFGVPSARPGGEWVAEWYPDGIGGATQIEVAATVEDVRSSTRLEVAPRNLSPSVMPFFGALSNFGAVDAVLLGLDLDLRFRAGWIGDTLSVRVTGASYGWTDDAETGLGQALSARSLVFPLGVAGVLRRNFGAFGGEGGLGLAAALHRVEARIGPTTVSSGSELLAGPYGLVAITRRAGIGEVALTVRGTFLPGLSGDLGWSGNLGGVSGDLGYRLLF